MQMSDDTAIEFVDGESDTLAYIDQSDTGICNHQPPFPTKSIILNGTPYTTDGNPLEGRELCTDHLVPCVYVKSYEEQRGRRYSQARRNSSFYDNYRRPSVASNRSRRGSRYSYTAEYEKKRRASHCRRSSSTKSAKVAQLELSLKQRQDEKRRRKIVFIVIATFVFILACCVLTVIVTLTHRSEVITTENKTKLYYTFAPPPDHVFHTNVGKYISILFWTIVRSTLI